MMTARSAVQFSLWLAVNHPDVFADVYRRALVAQSSRGLGRFGRSSRAAHVGRLGDDSVDLAPVDVTASYVDPSTFDSSSVIDLAPVDVTSQYIDESGNVISQQDAQSLFNLPSSVQPVDVSLPTPDLSTSLDMNSVNAAVNDPTITQTDPGTPGSTAGGSFLSALGQGLASATTALLKGAGTVAQGLTNPTTVKALAGAAQSYFTAQAQSTALQTQLARANAGLSPAPITYTRDAYGNLVPVMANPQTGTIAYNAQGQPYYVNPQTAQGLMPGITTGNLSATLSSLTPYLPYIIGGAALLFLFGGGRMDPAPARSYRPRRTHRGPRK